MIGSRLAHYELTGKLGSRGAGVVYRAWDPKQGRDVALKMLPTFIAKSPKHLARFERDCELVAALGHPHLVKVFSIEHAEGIAFMTMELVDGKTLSEEIDPAGMALSRLLEYAIPLTDAIASMHQHGVLHRALHPDHVLIGHEGCLKVINYGLGMPEIRQTASGHGMEAHSVRTTVYTPPEFEEGLEWDSRSDVFCLGRILSEMALGTSPFTMDEIASPVPEAFRRSPQLMLEIRPALPKDLQRIVRLCLAERPSQRVQSVLVLRQELEKLRADLEAGRLGERDATPEDVPMARGRWVRSWWGKLGRGLVPMAF